MGAISFSTDEASEIARALAAVAAADGAIRAREASFLDGFAMSHSVTGQQHLTTPLDAERLARHIVDPAKRREVLRLCVQMALSDGDYADAERRAVETIAAAFAVPADELDAIVAAARA